MSDLHKTYLNALKHGAFALTAILPGEEAGEFKKLHAALVEEWMPEGPTEEDAVLTIARCLWRKRRVQHFLHAKIAARAFDPDHPGFDRERVLIGMVAMMELAPDVLDQVLSVSPGPLGEYFEQKFPPAKYTSKLAWAQAVRKEITALLNSQLTSPYEEAPADQRLIQSADVLGEDLFKSELEAEARIDATLDRAIKRLVQTKAMKQVLASCEVQQAKRIQSSKRNGSQSGTRKHQSNH